MSNRFDNHSANERTFLAWVRTALATVGFGILVSRFAGNGQVNPGLDRTGLILLILGAALVLGAGVRFLLTRRHINSDDVEGEAPIWLDITLVVTLVFLIAALIGFGSHVVGAL